MNNSRVLFAASCAMLLMLLTSCTGTPDVHAKKITKTEACAQVLQEALVPFDTKNIGTIEGLKRTAAELHTTAITLEPIATEVKDADPSLASQLRTTYQAAAKAARAATATAEGDTKAVDELITALSAVAAGINAMNSTCNGI